MSKDIAKEKKENITYVDYKDVKALREFLNPHGRILNRKRTTLSAKEQRFMDNSVKHARFMGFLPYIDR